MHPKDIENFNATKSEKIMFDALKEQLDDTYHVFYSVTWYTDEQGERINSECDFLIFNSNYGFLTIEVKGGIRMEVSDGEWTLYSYDKNGDVKSRKLTKSPYKQAENSMHYFKKYYKSETLTNFRGIYGMAVAFPFFSIDVDLENDAPKKLTIQLSDMNNLKEKINELFYYWGGKNKTSFLSEEQSRKFIALVNRRVALSVAAGALIPITSKKLETINIIQDSIITLLDNYKRVQIIGGAGTGKTWIAIKKIMQQFHLGKKCLFTCYSSTLAKFVAKNLPKEVKVIDIESLFLESINTTAKVIFDSNGDREYYGLLHGKIDEKYDCIMVDEAQDFCLDWALTINEYIKESGYFYVFYDENQNIYARNFQDGFMIESEPYILNNNIRNTRNIHKWVKDKTAVGEQVISNDVFGSDPEVCNVKDFQGVKIRLNEILNKLILEECIDPDSIVVLGKNELDGDLSIGNFIVSNKQNDSENYILYNTVSSFKGLEANIIIYLNEWPSGLSKNKEYYDLLYIAGTRAKYYLYVLDYKV